MLKMCSSNSGNLLFFLSVLRDKEPLLFRILLLLCWCVCVCVRFCFACPAQNMRCDNLCATLISNKYFIFRHLNIRLSSYGISSDKRYLQHTRNDHCLREMIFRTIASPWTTAFDVRYLSWSWNICSGHFVCVRGKCNNLWRITFII